MASYDHLSTGLLVILATSHGLPVSTTHVSVGALARIGVMAGGASLNVVRNIAVAWVLTLPCAALIGSVVYVVAKRVGSL